MKRRAVDLRNKSKITKKKKGDQDKCHYKYERKQKDIVDLASRFIQVKGKGDHVKN